MVRSVPAFNEPPWNWNATAAEREQAYPCDALLPRPQHAFYRAIDVSAPPGLVYRWLQQLRIAPYSYDWADNFALPSPSRLTPRADEIAVGQRIMHILRIVSFEPGRSLTAMSSSAVGRVLFGELAGSYTVTLSSAGTRLFVKVNAVYPGGVYGRLVGPVMPWIDYAMMRKQLERIKAFAERDARQIGS
jgi:hypothetical protein